MRAYTGYRYVLNIIISDFCRIIIIILKVNVNVTAEIWIIIIIRIGSLIITFVINEMSPNFFRKEILYFKLRISNVLSKFLNINLNIILKNNT
jgi:hypothetical protein